MHPRGCQLSEKPREQYAYYCDLPTEMVLDLASLDGIWCLIGDDMVQLCEVISRCTVQSGAGGRPTLDAHGAVRLDASVQRVLRSVRAAVR